MSLGTSRTVLFEVAHPKHFLQFRHAMKSLSSEHVVRVIARRKDVVVQLLEEQGVSFTCYSRSPNGIRKKLLGAPKALLRYASVIRQCRPDLIVSKCSPYAAVLGRLTGVPTVVMPDDEGIVLAERFVIPLAQHVISPASLERDFGPKHRRITGFFEAGYLHPKHFEPDESVWDLLGLTPGDRFAVVRFVGWQAYHDAGYSGMSAKERVVLVHELARYLKVFVSAEGPVPESLAPHLIRIPVSRMHDVLHYASLYVGDSQSMATEAALLGTPAVRCNSFVGANDFSNFRILEDRYKLLSNHSCFKAALGTALALAVDAQAKETWRRRREHYFATVGDVNKEIDVALREIIATLPANGHLASA